MSPQRFDKVDDPRRTLLIQALTVGLLTVVFPGGRTAAQTVFGTKPARLPPGQSIYRIDGTVTVNGTAATLQTPVRPGDTVETGPAGEIIFAVGGNAMILRNDSRLDIEASAPASLLISGLRLLTGKLLSVSRNTQMRVVTSTATIGIRGTGWYAEADPEQTYFCTCYGSTEIAANADPASTENVVATQHDRPLYILGTAPAGGSIRNAPFINHTDQELMLIETLVGRTPPFIYPKGEYTGPRRAY